MMKRMMVLGLLLKATTSLYAAASSAAGLDYSDAFSAMKSQNAVFENVTNKPVRFSVFTNKIESLKSGEKRVLHAETGTSFVLKHPRTGKAILTDKKSVSSYNKQSTYTTVRAQKLITLNPGERYVCDLSQLMSYISGLTMDEVDQDKLIDFQIDRNVISVFIGRDEHSYQKRIIESVGDIEMRMQTIQGAQINKMSPMYSQNIYDIARIMYGLSRDDLNLELGRASVREYDLENMTFYEESPYLIPPATYRLWVTLEKKPKEIPVDRLINYINSVQECEKNYRHIFSCLPDLIPETVKYLKDSGAPIEIRDYREMEGDFICGAEIKYLIKDGYLAFASDVLRREILYQGGKENGGGIYFDIGIKTGKLDRKLKSYSHLFLLHPHGEIDVGTIGAAAKSIVLKTNLELIKDIIRKDWHKKFIIKSADVNHGILSGYSLHVLFAYFSDLRVYGNFGFMRPGVDMILARGVGNWTERLFPGLSYFSVDEIIRQHDFLPSLNVGLVHPKQFSSKKYRIHYLQNAFERVGVITFASHDFTRRGYKNNLDLVFDWDGSFNNPHMSAYSYLYSHEGSVLRENHNAGILSKFKYFLNLSKGNGFRRDAQFGSQSEFYLSSPQTLFKSFDARGANLVFYEEISDNKRLDILDALDGAEFLNWYGEIRFKDKKSYKGAITSDIQEIINKHHIALVLHSVYQNENEEISSQIFEAASAGSIIIADNNAALAKEFGNAILYVDHTQPSECIAEEITRHICWIKDNPEAAVSLARKAHLLFLEKFSVEDQVVKIIQTHQKAVILSGGSPILPRRQFQYMFDLNQKKEVDQLLRVTLFKDFLIHNHVENPLSFGMSVMKVSGANLTEDIVANNILAGQKIHYRLDENCYLAGINDLLYGEIKLSWTIDEGFIVEILSDVSSLGESAYYPHLSLNLLFKEELQGEQGVAENYRKVFRKLKLPFSVENRITANKRNALQIVMSLVPPQYVGVETPYTYIFSSVGIDQFYPHDKSKQRFRGTLQVGENSSIKGVAKYGTLREFYHTHPDVEFSPLPRREQLGIFFCGSAWDNRYPNLLKILDEKSYFNWYGYSGLAEKKSYRGFSGVPVEDVKKHGIALLLHNKENLRNSEPASKIFEAAAGSAVIISDKLGFIMKAFGDSVFYIDQNDPEEKIAHDIENYYRWIVDNPVEAQEMARKAHAIFIEKFTLEDQIARLVNFHQETLLLDGYSTLSPRASFIIRSSQNKKMLMQAMNVLLPRSLEISSSNYDDFHPRFFVKYISDRVVAPVVLDGMMPCEFDESVSQKTTDVNYTSQSFVYQPLLLEETQLRMTDGFYFASIDVSMYSDVVFSWDSSKYKILFVN